MLVTSLWTPAPTSYDVGSNREGDGVDVRIGIIQAPRELNIEIPDEVGQEAILASIEAELAKPEGVLWLTDRRGSRVGVPTARIAYVEIGAVDVRRVGFGAT
jgi:hypothetical protein